MAKCSGDASASCEKAAGLPYLWAACGGIHTQPQKGPWPRFTAEDAVQAPPHSGPKVTLEGKSCRPGCAQPLLTVMIGT